MNAKGANLVCGVPERKVELIYDSLREPDVDQHPGETFNSEIFKKESKSYKVLSSPSLEIFKEMLKNHLCIRVVEGILKPAGGLHESVSADGKPSDFS